MNMNWQVILTPKERRLYREIRQNLIKNVRSIIVVQLLMIACILLCFYWYTPPQTFFSVPLLGLGILLFFKKDSQRFNYALTVDESIYPQTLAIQVKFMLMGWCTWLLGFVYWYFYAPHALMFILVAMTIVGAINIALVGFMQRVFLSLIAIELAVALTMAVLYTQGEKSYFLIQIAFMGIFHLALLWLQNLRIVDILESSAKNYALLTELNQKNFDLEHIKFSQSRYLSAVSHDLRQPLYALTLLAHDMTYKNTNPILSGPIERANDALESMNQFFSSMLNLSRLDTQGITPKFSQFPLRQLLNRLQIEFEPAATLKQLNLHLDATDIWVNSDPDMLYSILSNLVSNAIRYTEEGAVRVRVLERPNGQLHLKVIDTGVGIPAQDKSKIFQEYIRLDYAKQRVTGGVGLGLSIGLRMARLLGHRISVRSRTGVGSIFSIVLSNYTSPIFPTPIPTTEYTELVLQHKTALIFEDDLTIAQALSDLLISWGMSTHLCQNSQDFLEKFTHGTPIDVVLSDLHLGRTNEDGIDVILYVRQHMKNTHFVALLITGDTTEELIERAASKKIHLLHKPLSPEHLRRTLSEMLIDTHRRNQHNDIVTTATVLNNLN